MSLFNLPPYVHVDPNMHPNLYKNLLHFALVFDKVSLYAVSGSYLSRPGSPLTVDDFVSLVRDPADSPFLLTGPSDWFDKDQRAERLNQDIVGWHEYDDRVVNEVGLSNVLRVPNSPFIRDTAWEETLRYHDLIVAERLDLTEYDGPPHMQVVNRAYLDAKTQFLKDQENHQARVLASDNKRLAKLSYDGVLPATFYHNITHTQNYSDLLREGDALSCLIFEHCTKYFIIAQIEKQIRDRGGSGNLAMYVPDVWHKLLMKGQSLGSSADYIRVNAHTFEEAYARYALEEIDRLFRDRPEGFVGQRLVDEIKDLRRRGMPAVLRKMIERNLDRIIMSENAKGLETAMRDSVVDLVELCKSVGIGEVITKVVVESIVVGCLFGGGSLVGWMVGAENTTRIITEASAIFELSRSGMGNFLTEKWMESLPSGKRQYLLGTLNRWFRSGQPTRSIFDKD